MDFLPVKLLFSPIRIAFLIVWFYLCMYLVQRFEFSPIVPKKLKAYMNVLMLVFGPFVLFVFVAAEAAAKVLQQGVPFMDAVKGAFQRAGQIVDVSHFAGSRSKSSLVLLDSSGKDMFQVFGGKDKTDRSAIEHTHLIIANALDELASDILVDPINSETFSIRYRIDGMLRTVEEIDFRKCAAIVNCVKAVSSMDIAERRRPQDGAFIAKTADGNVSFRVASAGVLHGEKLSIRILNLAAKHLSLADVGMNEKYQQLVKETISHQQGMILVCGPTGSGKSTTMQAMLCELDFNSRNVITIEDPIEYVLPQASQIEINPKADITFAKALRSVLRQDPDVISVGEIRDAETASVALSASQTGHLVLATLHSSSNAGTIVRLMDLGVKPLLISSAVDLIISQRLVRKLCPRCNAVAELTETQVSRFQQSKVDMSKIMQAKGCEYCNNTGYKGRIGIFDMMVIDDTVKAQILSEKFSVSSFKNFGDENYKTNLRKQALKLAISGVTSLAEVKRVTSNLG